MPPISPQTVKSWLDDGVMFALSLFVIWALCAAAVLLYRWGSSKVATAAHEDHLKRCDGCAFSEDWRSPQDLIAHRLFGYLRLARASMIPNLPISDLGRSMVFGDLLDAKCRIVAEHYLLWLKKNMSALETMHADTLASEHLSLVGDIVEAYESEARRMGIPAPVMEKFRYWHNPRIIHLRAEIILVCESEWITDTAQRVGFILSVVEHVMKATVFDAERTLSSLNGSLTGHVYRGVTIGPMDGSHGEGSARAVAPLSRPDPLKQEN